MYYSYDDDDDDNSSDDDFSENEIVYREEQPISNEYYEKTLSSNKVIIKRKYGFNHPVDNLPVTTKTLFIYSNLFNQSLDNLPLNLESITLKVNIFNYPLDNLPINIKHIFLQSREFNRPLDNLPPRIETLEIFNNIEFNQTLNNLPINLSKLIICSEKFNQSLDNLPLNLTELKISSENFNIPISYLPKKLKILSLIGANIFNSPIYELPSILEELYLPYTFNSYLPEMLPETLNRIYAPSKIIKYVDKLDKIPIKSISINAFDAYNNIEKLIKLKKNKGLFIAISSLSGLCQEFIPLCESNFVNFMYEIEKNKNM